MGDAITDDDLKTGGKLPPRVTPSYRRIRGSPEEAHEAMLRCLARREHSEHELRRKLARKYLSPEVVDDIIGALQDEGLQSDVRFTEDFMHSMMERGYGYGRIYSGLRERGVETSIIKECLPTDEQTWFDLARRALQKRFGDDAPIEYYGDEEERAAWLSRARYLERRGFARDIVVKVLDGRSIER